MIIMKEFLFSICFISLSTNLKFSIDIFIMSKLLHVTSMAQPCVQRKQNNNFIQQLRQKYLKSCSEDEQRTNGFGSTWVNSWQTLLGELAYPFNLQMPYF